jgi:hypothetical protein
MPPSYSSLEAISITSPSVPSSRVLILSPLEPPVYLLDDQHLLHCQHEHSLTGVQTCLHKLSGTEPCSYTGIRAAEEERSEKMTFA